MICCKSLDESRCFFEQLDGESPSIFGHFEWIVELALHQCTLLTSSTDVPVACHQSAYAVQMSTRWDDERRSNQLQRNVLGRRNGNQRTNRLRTTRSRAAFRNTNCRRSPTRSQANVHCTSFASFLKQVLPIRVDPFSGDRVSSQSLSRTELEDTLPEKKKTLVIA